MRQISTRSHKITTYTRSYPFNVFFFFFPLTERLTRLKTLILHKKRQNNLSSFKLEISSLERTDTHVDSWVSPEHLRLKMAKTNTKKRPTRAERTSLPLPRMKNECLHTRVNSVTFASRNTVSTFNSRREHFLFGAMTFKLGYLGHHGDDMSSKLLHLPEIPPK